MKNLIFLLVLCTLFSGAYSQPNWTKTYGSLVHEEILSSHTDATGNIISAGCFQTDTVEITWTDCSLFMPNVFTPDNDGINDVLYFDATHGEVLSMVIQNRWGMIMYQGTEGSWDGNDLNGSPAVAGTYFYVIEYRNADQSIKLEQGWFFLQR